MKCNIAKEAIQYIDWKTGDKYDEVISIKLWK